jgi:uncharacterized protein YlzI (FlbEa/FlbD family)
MKFAAFVLAVSCAASALQHQKEVSINGVSYFVQPWLADQAANLPAHEQLQRISRMGKQLRAGQGMKEVSVNGVSYFVNAALADQVANLPAHEQLQRISRIGKQHRAGQGMKEVSVNGVSYFVNAALADQVANLPAVEQLKRIQTTTGQNPNLQEFSVDGQSYFISPFLAERIAGLPANEQLNQINSEQRLPKSGMFNQKEVSINGVSYFVDEDLATRIATLPPQQQLAAVTQKKTPRSLIWTGSLMDDLEEEGTTEFTRMTRSLNLPVQFGSSDFDPMVESELEEVSVNGKSHFVKPWVARKLAGLPAGDQLQIIRRAMARKFTDTYSQSSGAEKEVSIHGVSYLVPAAIADQLGGLNPREQMVRLQEWGLFR